MSERKVDAEIVQKQCINDTSLIDEAEIIDVSAFDFDDTGSWLYIPTRYQTESTVQDLYTWLRSEPELNLSANRKSVDTRTFTRSKKRSTKTCFESIFETLSSPVANIWKTSNFSNVEEDLNKYSDLPTANKDEAVPPMLKMAPITNVSLLNDEAVVTSGQESMEVFLNMSHSKGIDSFINLMEPGLSDPLMNVSQPSIFYSSITSLSRDDSLHNADCGREEEFSNSIHMYNKEIDKHKDAKNSNMNETFSKDNESYCLSPTDETFTNGSAVMNKVELNQTYDTEAVSAEIVELNSDKDKSSTNSLSSILVNKDDGNAKFLQPRGTEKIDSSSLNTTYPSNAQKVGNPLALDSTYSPIKVENVPAGVTSTFRSDTKRDKGQPFSLETNASCSTSKNAIESSAGLANSTFSLDNDVLDSPFKLPPGYQSTPISMDTLNSTYKASNKQLESCRVYNTTWSSNFKAPTSLRKELLAEIHRSGDHRLDCTYNHTSKEHQSKNSKTAIVEKIPSQNVKSDIPIENKYNTYKKESSSVDKIKPQTEINETKTCVHKLQEKKYYTFTKKNSAHGGKTDMENAESLENMDSTFVKPLPKLQKQKQHIPRMLSKLPQFLQKSNPNLVSNSLKTVNMTGYTNASTFGYMKGSQPNIVRDVEKSLTNKLYSLGKMKSGSEQRLLELNSGVGELQLLGAGGSTESIESTQSAHSAPDLDDRLSTCSDSSHNSCTTQPMNIEQLQQIVRMQEESLRQDTRPQLKRVLENTWIDMKTDLHSAIVKNGVDGCEGDDLPLSIDFTFKTSSPILSPTRSSQSINTDGQSTETVIKQQNDTEVVKKVEAFNKPMMKVENKTRLRQPTNWNSGNRPPNVMSAIPRPPSRIPAPRFAKPIVKNIQGDIKRGYM
nr:uncharacterized protein LOC117609975 isoform X1 [Osmia lignaria]XP_034192691.1 uncharacterized protein LOC117609975 isoform X1 [Osmia lignaria]